MDAINGAARVLQDARWQTAFRQSSVKRGKRELRGLRLQIPRFRERVVVTLLPEERFRAALDFFRFVRQLQRAVAVCLAPFRLLPHRRRSFVRTGCRLRLLELAAL